MRPSLKPGLTFLVFLAHCLSGLACGADSGDTHADAASAGGGPLADQLAVDQRAALVTRNLDMSVSLPADLLSEHMQRWQNRPVGERIALWAELFHERGDATYRFGLLDGGYVKDGLLVQDFKPDCVLFFYRCTDLARSQTPEEAVLRALETRFAGAADSPVDADGRVDYENAAHIDYSLDIVRSGTWGREVTREVGEAMADAVGTSRYPAGSFHYIPTANLRYENLRDGDHLFFVLDEGSKRGRKLRDEYGLVVGHQGIARVDGNEVYVIHAASKDLPGEYEGNRVVRVRLQTYLERVESHKGVLVTRVEETTPH